MLLYCVFGIVRAQSAEQSVAIIGQNTFCPKHYKEYTKINKRNGEAAWQVKSEIYN